MQKRAPAYDKDREEHYNLISALHKSIRGSDPDAALYWLARMLAGGEAPLFLARRLVRAAAEDIGLADPTALLICNAAKDAVDFLGVPEAELHLAQAVIHLATAPKSNAAYVAWGAAKQAARETGTLGPPMHIRNAPTKLMKSSATAQAIDTTTTRRAVSRAKTTSRTKWNAACSTIRRARGAKRRSKSGWRSGEQSVSKNRRDETFSLAEKVAAQRPDEGRAASLR